MLSLYALLSVLLPVLVQGLPGNRTRIRVNTREDELPEIALDGAVVADPDCAYRILREGPGGAELYNNATVGDRVYHEITCKGRAKTEDAYCLTVFNCTIGSKDGKTVYDMIDEYGCTLEPLLFEDVEYEGDLRAGIRAQAIRFHTSSKVQFHCQTRLLVKGKGKCADRRPKCIKNEYFLGSALKVNAPPRLPG